MHLQEGHDVKPQKLQKIYTVFPDALLSTQSPGPLFESSSPS